MRTNWAGNHTYQAPDLACPDSIEAVQSLVAGAAHVRALGSRHSFNAIADTPGTQVSMERLNRVLSIDPASHSVTAEGGILYGELATELDAQGFALANLASLPHISVAGAIATATHGSGSNTGNLATAVAAMDVITPSGDIRNLSRAADSFAGVPVHLGALGIIARLTLDIEPAYTIRQTVYRDLPFNTLTENFDAIFDAAKSISVFTDWRGDAASSVWVKARAGDPDPGGDFFGAPAAATPIHPLPGGDASACTEQMGTPGAWVTRLPHFRMEFTPSVGAEIQAEYFLPREEAAKAIAVMRSHADRLAPVLMLCELRTIAADDLWLSPCYRRDTMAIHFTFHRDWPAIRKVLPAVEADLTPLGAIPHWGKVTTMDPALIRSRFPRLPEFQKMARDLDPGGKFANDFTRSVLTP